MPPQEVGVRAIFDTHQFGQGLKRYIDGLADAILKTNTAVASLNQMATAFNTAFAGNTQNIGATTAALNQMASAAKSALKATKSSGSGAAGGALTALQRDVEIQRQIKNEIRDRISDEKQLATIRAAGTSDLAKQAAHAERAMIQAFRGMRDAGLANLQLPPDFFESIRNADVALSDMGTAAKQQVRDLGAEYRLLTEEVRDRVRAEQILQTLNTGRITQLERERNILELQTIALAQQTRLAAAMAQGGPRLVGEVNRIRTTPVAPADIGRDTSLLDNELAINKLISDELRDRLSLAKAIDKANDASTTDAERQKVAIQSANSLLERQKRLAELVRLGGDPARLAAVNALHLTAIDLGKRENDQILKQIEAQKAIQDEIAATVELEKISVILKDRASTSLQKQAANARLVTMELERQLRIQAGGKVGVAPKVLDDIRKTTVATRDLGTAMRQASGGVQGLSAASVALGVVIGSAVVGGIRRAAQAITTMGRAVLETVAFYERLELSIGFFAARSLEGGAAALSYKEKIAATAVETEGLSLWLQRLAVASPFTTRDVGTLFRVSQAYGLLRSEAEILTPLLLDFAAAAGLDSDILERLALAMGQVRARGKLTGEEVRQLGNSGVPVRDILVKTLGIANDEFDELLESGALTSDIVIPAIIKALKEFEGAGEAVAFGTIGGIISAFKELKDISTAKFFRAAFEPLKESFKALFQTINDPSVMATITVLGEQLGTVLTGALHSLQAAMKGTVAGFLALNSSTIQNAVVFVGAAAIALGLIAAFGLMVVAVNILTSPVVVLTIAVASLITAWTAGFRTLKATTAPAVALLGGMLTGLAEFGVAAGNLFAAGFASAASAIAGAAAVIANSITFWFAPGSPPRVAPKLDQWGKAHGQLYLDSYAEANPETPFNKLGEVIGSQLTQVSIDATKKALDQYNKYNAEFQVSLARDLNQQTRGAFGIAVTQATEAAFEGSEEVAAEAGIRVSEAYIEGFGHMIRKIKEQVTPELQEALDALGQGRQLSAAGAFTFNQYLSGFKDGDFGILEEASGIVEGFLKNLVDQGQLSEGDLLVKLFGSRQEIAAALQNFRQTGKISQNTLSQITASSGEAGAAVRDLLTAYGEFATADTALTLAQKQLVEINKEYKAVLEPIRKELERISALRQASDENQEILSLRRLIANEAVSEFRKENARLKIAEILQGRRVRGIEAQQKVEVDAKQATIDSAQERSEAAQEQLQLVKGLISAQLTQLGLVGQESSLMKRLQEEVDKQREKQKTALDLQVELLKLQQAELGDLQKAAKAKYILELGSSSEMEKQNAILDLQEVSLARRQRLLEAKTLGIPEEELTKLYNFEVTLDDIGIKTKKDLSGLGGGLDGLTQSTLDATLQAQEWQKELEKARIKIWEVKEQLRLMFEEINRNLPSWLKIFPEKEGERPPIIQTLIDYRNAILAVGVAIVVSKILVGLGSMLLFFQAIGGGGGMVAALGAGGAGGRAALAIRAIGTAIVWVATTTGPFLAQMTLITKAIFIAYLAAQGLAQVFHWLEQHPFGRSAISLTPGAATSGPPLPLDTNFDDLFEQDFFANPFAEAPTPQAGGLDKYSKVLKVVVATAVNQAVAQGLGEAGISSLVMAEVGAGIASGLLPNDGTTKTAAVEYMQTLIDALRLAGEIESPSALSGREVGEPFGEGIVGGVLSVLALASARGGRIEVALLGMVNFFKTTLMGEDGLRPFMLGSNWMLGITQGITSQRQTLADALVDGLDFALGAAQQALMLRAGPALATSGNAQMSAFGPVDARFGGRPSQSYPGGTTNITNQRNYYLNVSSSASSQGIIRDFSVMQTMEGA